MSSLVYLGFSVVVFIITYGLMFMLLPSILGVFFSLSDNLDMNASWQATYDETESVTRWLIPLMPTIGIFILVIKVLMVASTRGRD